MSADFEFTFITLAYSPVKEIEYEIEVTVEGTYYPAARGNPNSWDSFEDCWGSPADAEYCITRMKNLTNKTRVKKEWLDDQRVRDTVWYKIGDMVTDTGY